MKSISPTMKMPELLVFARAFAIGFIAAEVWQICFYLGNAYAKTIPDVALWQTGFIIFIITLICFAYLYMRGAHLTATLVGRSLRLDLGVTVIIGIWANQLALPSLSIVHAPFINSNSNIAPLILLLLCVILSSSLFRHFSKKSKSCHSQLRFFGDDEIRNKEDDILEIEIQAKAFAEAVIASDTQPGLIFGVDGPWGVGKTSFVNLAQRYWDIPENKIIVCRFEPLRYASEPDIADRLIRDLSAEIKRKVFAPEFSPVASRYSRLIKGKADISFFGFKLSLEPSKETIDELIEDIDEVLKRIDHRVIIVIDDLDRLDVRTINDILFATRRTFRLSQASYVLCYDTEMLVEKKEDGSRTRDFLEKFVTVKLSLFVDSSRIYDFLKKDWKNADNQYDFIPADTMLKLGAILNELADLLNGELAAKYQPLLGDLRKVKRFVNAMVLMQIEKSDLGLTDFNKQDLINLMLLHLNFPGLFRRIYAEETENRCGIFSLRREPGEREFKNSTEFLNLVESEQHSRSGFLLKQLFSIESLRLGSLSDIDEEVIASRACFNDIGFRNLENYLKLIVRFVTPEPQSTFALYQKAVERVQNGEPIHSILESSDFQSQQWENVHDKFWSMLVNRSHNFNYTVAEAVINALVDYLPHYPSELRERSIDSLLILLDNCGWGRRSGRRLPNTNENIVEIAWRIFGEHSYDGYSLLNRLASRDRGVLGWRDLISFRLKCSGDRREQLYNLQSALIINTDKNAATTGLVNDLALVGMRRISQEIFSLFKQTYIEPKINFYSEASAIPEEEFLGKSYLKQKMQSSIADDHEIASAEKLVAEKRNSVKSFVMFQLSNAQPPTGTGVGCGYYDESDDDNNAGIARLMNEYVFGICFNPNIQENNILHFLDHCLSHLSNRFFSGMDEDGYFASKDQLIGGFNSKEMGLYWSQHRDFIREKSKYLSDRQVVTSNYTVSYGEYLDKIFEVLDVLADEANNNNQ